MFCPSCGNETHEPLKFCKQCGVNLRRIQGVMGKGGAGARTNSPVSWDQVALEEYQEERDRKKKKTPEEKRLNEIKGGVIAASAGLAGTIFFSYLFDAIANVMGSDPAANIVRSLWAVGLIPLLVGLGIIFNGLVVSRKIVEVKRQEEPSAPQPLFSAVPGTSPVPQLPAAAQSPIGDYSITEPTTTKLREPVAAPLPRDTN
ncbi:MAG: hypothetical protein ABIU20_08480 [Blastocatellia bacterium]